MSKALALIVDDEPDIRELLNITLSRMDIATRCAANLHEALALLQNQRFDLCLADMRLPDGNGLEIVRHITRHHAGTPVAVITAHGNMETAVEALKAGAFDFVSKPVDLPVLRDLVATALRIRQEPSSDDPASTVDDHELLGQSADMQEIRRLIGKLARSQAPVFISGESGTGKELAARLIHHHSPRRTHAFIAVNCGAIPQELMESELFGHRKGSFTGAIADKPGLFQAADGGTLLLDEVADLPLSMQVKLLRAIQERRIRPIGSAEELPVDVRVISATHKDIAGMLTRGEFRRDLYYRLHVIELAMPPLRARPEDITALAEHVLDRIAGNGGLARPHLASDAQTALARYGFPGNVRELENILERATALCDDGVIHAQDLGLTTAQPPNSTNDPHRIGLEAYLNELERRAISEALDSTRGNRTAAARLLGITFRALRYRLEKLGMDTDTDDQSDHLRQ